MIAEQVEMSALQAMPLPRLLAVSGHLLSARWSRLTEAHGLTPTGLALLGVLAEEDGVTHRDAAARCWVSPGTLTPVVDVLERDGRVLRDRDPVDRRIVRLSITAAGRRRLVQAREEAVGAMGSVFAGVDPADEAVIRTFLVTTIGRLQGQRVRR